MLAMAKGMSAFHEWHAFAHLSPPSIDVWTV